MSVDVAATNGIHKSAATNGVLDSPSKRAKVEQVKEGEMELQVKRMTELATLPTKGSPFSAGFDLYASEALAIPPKDRAMVKTDIQIAVPVGFYGRVAPRSGLAVKQGIDVGAGVVDSDYRGEVKVLLFNFGAEEFKVEKGDRIAQLVIERIATPKLVEVTNLEETQRGEGGFGSTGK